MSEYQFNYTDNPVALREMYDAEARETKAEKIRLVLQDYLGDTRSRTLLDVSCSTGIMARRLAGEFGSIVGIDIDAAAVEFAARHSQAPNLSFHVMDALNISFPSDSFDTVVCNQMYEHVPDAVRLLTEIHRVLKPGGVCYFGATNRLKIVETHYGRLPFLSYLPKPLAGVYLRILGRGTRYYENLRTFWGLRDLCANFEIIDYTEQVLADPARFASLDVITPASMQQRIALAVIKYAYWASPGYIWLLRKPPGMQ